MHAYRHNQMIYHVTRSGILRKFIRNGCIVPVVMVRTAVAAVGVAAVVSSGEKSESEDFSCHVMSCSFYMQKGLTWPLREPEVGKCAW